MARFGRQNRLLKPVDFKRVFSGKIKSVDSSFVVLAVPNDQDESRLGLAVAKKHLKLAVDRNRVKRVIRESFRSGVVLELGLDVVVLSRHSTGKNDNKTLFASLERHWSRLKKQCKNS